MKILKHINIKIINEILVINNLIIALKTKKIEMLWIESKVRNIAEAQRKFKFKT